MSGAMHALRAPVAFDGTCFLPRGATFWPRWPTRPQIRSSPVDPVLCPRPGCDRVKP